MKQKHGGLESRRPRYGGAAHPGRSPIPKNYTREEFHASIQGCCTGIRLVVWDEELDAESARDILIMLDRIETLSGAMVKAERGEKHRRPKHATEAT